jgi:hypothetical protein
MDEGAVLPGAVCLGSGRRILPAGGVFLKGIRKRKRDPYYEMIKVASATECTGLMPSLPQSDDEDENYASLYSTHDSPPD